MVKLFLLMLTIGSFVFSGSWNNATQSDNKSNYKQYNMVEDVSSDDYKSEAGRKRGKGQRGRRRGGGGLR